MSRIRHHRLLPIKENATRPWQFTDLDRQILMYLARYRYARGTTLHQLVDRKPVSVNYALRKLFDRRLLDKPRSQALGYNSLNDTDIYEITKKGLTFLTEAVPEATNLVREVTDTPVKNFRHAMMICDVLQSMEIGARKAMVRFISQAEILNRAKVANPMKLPCMVAHRFQNGMQHRQDTYLVPDGVFGIEYADKTQRLYLVEAEHYNPLSPTNLFRASFLKKIIAYDDILKKKTTRNHFGKSSFHVLFVFPTLVRATSAQGVVETVFKTHDRFLMRYTAVQEEIWKSPKPDMALFSQPWLRGGLPPVSIKEPPTA